MTRLFDRDDEPADNLKTIPPDEGISFINREEIQSRLNQLSTHQPVFQIGTVVTFKTKQNTPWMTREVLDYGINNQREIVYLLGPSFMYQPTDWGGDNSFTDYRTGLSKEENLVKYYREITDQDIAILLTDKTPRVRSYGSIINNKIKRKQD
jgi:hypothetical protein